MKGSQPIILAAMTITIGNTVINNLASPGRHAPAFKIVVGGYLVTVALLIGSEANPEVAESLAILIMMATLFGPNGDTLVSVVQRLTKTGSIKANVQNVKPTKVSLGYEGIGGHGPGTITTSSDFNDRK